MLVYRIELEDVAAHQFRVTLTLPQPAAQQELALPVWIPGSYMVREFAKHLGPLHATQGGRQVPLRQLDKARWCADCVAGADLTVTYRVYAFDPSVRTAWLDAQRAFFNASSLCLRAPDRDTEPHRLELAALPAGWQVATAMAAVDGGYQAANYDELIDHPFEMGLHWQGSFEAGGVPHRVVVAGAWPSFDGERLLADVRRICEAQIAFWGEAPFDHYTFMLWAVDDGFGGLEHRASTALIAPRRDLPTAHEPAVPSDGYVNVLGLFSHEYFHAWNVKRLRPAEFARFDYQAENYTELLWFFEGFTSYYDEQMLCRAGVIEPARYLKLLAKAVNGVLAAPGRRVQPLAQSSFEAWTKYYRPDENTPNAVANYYGQGALVGLALDLSLREQGDSLDALMRRLWAQSAGGPVSEADILAQAGACAQALHRWVHEPGDLPLAELLEAHGVTWRGDGQAGLAQRLGVKLRESPQGGLSVTQVYSGSAALAAGLSARDEILGANGWRLRRLDEILGLLPRGERQLKLLVCRDQRLMELVAELPPEQPAGVALSMTPVEGQVLQRRQAWLGG